LISNLIAYSFVATRARGMYSNLLRVEDYQQLLKADNLWEFEKVLRKVYPSTGAAHATKGASQAFFWNASELEDRIVGQFLGIARKIRRDLPKAEAAFVAAIAMEYEVFNIKALLRGRLLGTPAQKVRDEMIPLGVSALLPWEELLAEDEMPEILRTLRAHPLGAAIEKAYLEKYLKSHSSYAMDAQIDVEYMLWLFDQTKQFVAEEARLLRKLIGQRIDAMNVSWILRFKTNFKMAPEEIMVELIPRGYHLNLPALKGLAFAEDLKLMLATLREYPWQRYLPADKCDIPQIEIGLERYLKDQYHGIFRRAPLRFAGVAAFVLLAQAVAQDTVKIMEATEYRLSKEGIQPELHSMNRLERA